MAGPAPDFPNKRKDGTFMKAKFVIAAVAALALAPCALIAQAPAGATGKCKDGTYTTQATKSGACKGHKGIDTWMGASSASAKSSSTAATTPAASAKSSTAAAAPAAAKPAAAPAASASSSASTASSAKSSSAKSSAAAKTPAAGGGPGMVWVNTSSNVYHCYGSKNYGTTKAGKYMSEADAKAAGAHADHGQACSK